MNLRDLEEEVHALEFALQTHIHSAQDMCQRLGALLRRSATSATAGRESPPATATDARSDVGLHPTASQPASPNSCSCERQQEVRLAVASVVLECNKAFAEQRREAVLRRIAMEANGENDAHSVHVSLLVPLVVSVFEASLRELHADVCEVLNAKAGGPSTADFQPTTVRGDPSSSSPVATACSTHETLRKKRTTATVDVYNG